jgi:hypothetical protein
VIFKQILAALPGLDYFQRGELIRRCQELEERDAMLFGEEAATLCALELDRMEAEDAARKARAKPHKAVPRKKPHRTRG